MSKAEVRIEGFIANELKVRDAGGHRIVEVTVPHTPQKLVDGRWTDAGETTWWRASFWDEHADAVLMTVQKGELVWLTGGVKVSSFTKSDQSVGMSVEVVNPQIAPVVVRPKRRQERELGVIDEPREPLNEPWESSQVPF